LVLFAIFRADQAIKGYEMEDILKDLLQEEQELQFTSFNETTAWQIGTRWWNMQCVRTSLSPLTSHAESTSSFHASLPGTSADNDEWVKRKVRLGESLRSQFVLHGANAPTQRQKHRRKSTSFLKVNSPRMAAASPLL
jgi:uncharacterized protein (UPF0303 family)